MRILPLARSVVDPAAHRRGESLTTRAADPATRVVLVHEGRIATAADGTALDLWGADRLAAFAPSELAGTGPHRAAPDGPDRVPHVGDDPLWLFLGEHDGVTYLGLLFTDLSAGDADDLAAAAAGPGAVERDPADCTWSTLREVGHLLDDLDADLATTAVALAEWHRRNTRCPRCGAPTRAELGGWLRRCPVDGGEEYPRTDAAVIMAVTDDAGRLLLAHGAHWAGRRFSTLAGFVEPGESLETAVRREVAEEVGIHVDDVAYVASQPWPFPASLMVAFRAHATTTEITVDGREVTDARWFTRAELHAAVRDGGVTLPMRTSVALALIEQWYGGPLGEPAS